MRARLAGRGHEGGRTSRVHAHKRRLSCCDFRNEMELNGALSNPRPTPEGSLASLCQLRKRLLEQSRDGLRDVELRPRPVPVQALVEAFVRSTRRPVRVREVCEALEAQGVGSFDKAAVRKTLHDGTRATVPRFRRIGWGLYETAAMT
jgi:hypothetical protein